MTEYGERFYTTPHLHINGKAVAFGRDTDGMWCPLSKLHPEVDEESDDVEKATDPGDIARICEALTNPLGITSLANKASMNYHNVRRLIPRMVRQGMIRPVIAIRNRGKAGHERPVTVYELT